MSMPKYMGGLGFRDFELFNLALLARQAWRILENPESLSARILKSAYFSNTDFLSAALGNHPSQIWRAVIEGRDTLKQGLIRRIGNGETTNIWGTNWIPRKENMRPIVSLLAQPPQYVSELIDSANARWNVPLLEQVFLPYDTAAIQRIPICTRNFKDFWSWGFEKNGIFSVRSAYRMIVATKTRREDWLDQRAGTSNTAAVEKSWEFLWGVTVPAKIKVFLWRLAQQSIPTEDVRKHRKMSTNDLCSVCGMQDSWRHSLIECNMARCVWALVDHELLEHMIATTEPSARSWLFSMFEV
uniref:Reverse transcriptase zinc-binding domain-containing protein n=1 Tax=Aegilops tauschii subsp. strangulata TaxID=200361 RepID=A0A452XY77_AEGTS